MFLDGIEQIDHLFGRLVRKPTGHAHKVTSVKEKLLKIKAELLKGPSICVGSTLRRLLPLNMLLDNDG